MMGQQINDVLTALKNGASGTIKPEGMVGVRCFVINILEHEEKCVGAKAGDFCIEALLPYPPKSSVSTPQDFVFVGGMQSQFAGYFANYYYYRPRVKDKTALKPTQTQLKVI